MSYLLDTHMLIWLMSEHEKLSKTVRAIIENSDNALFYSPLSFAKIAIKASIGKINMTADWQIVYANTLHTNGIYPIAPSWQDSVILQKLPFHHKDPFDRMLIACAKAN